MVKNCSDAFCCACQQAEVVQLPQHVEPFAKQAIDGFLLCRLDEVDLDDLGGLSRLDKTKIVRLASCFVWAPHVACSRLVLLLPKRRPGAGLRGVSYLRCCMMIWHMQLARRDAALESLRGQKKRSVHTDPRAYGDKLKNEL